MSIRRSLALAATVGFMATVAVQGQLVGPLPAPSFHLDTAAAPIGELRPEVSDPGPTAQAAPAYTPASPARYLSNQGSTYIPLDSWIYPVMLRLYSKGFVDSAFLGLRPWTRLSVEHMLELSADRINDSDDDDARET